jgi:hypothetical protein
MYDVSLSSGQRAGLVREVKPAHCARDTAPRRSSLGLAFDDKTAVLGALAGVLLSELAASLPIAALLNRGRQAPAAPGTDRETPSARTHR